MKRDFLHISDFTSQEILDLISFAGELKIKLRNKDFIPPFKNHSLAMVSVSYTHLTLPTKA